jgi:hypothetical protein
MSNVKLKNAKSKLKSKFENSEDQRHQMIEVEAYSIALARGFCDGNEADDWYAAEIQVDKQLSR